MLNKKKPGAREYQNDRRVLVIRRLRRGLLVLFCCALIAGLYLHRDDLNAANFRRILNSFDLGGGKNAESGLSFPLETGLSTSVRSYRQGYAALNCDTLRYMDGSGKEVMAVQLAYEDPALLTGDQTILAYDRGGLGYCVAGSTGVLLQGQTKGSILGAGLNREGAFALITSEPGYRSAVTLFDKTQKEIYKWFTSSYYLTLAAVREDGGGFAVAGLSEESNNFSARIIALAADREEPLFIYDLGNEYPLALAYLDGGALCAVTESKILLLNERGEETARFEAEDVFSAVSVPAGGPPYAGWIDRHTGDTRLVTLSSGGKLYERTLPEALRFLSAEGGCAAAMAGENIYLLNNRLEDISDPFSFSGVRRLAADPRGKVGVVFYDRVVVCG